MLRQSRLVGVSALALVLPLSLSACGGSSDSSADSGQKKVVTSFYPLEYAAQQIGGDKVKTSDLTKAGAEPHDLDLTPQQVADITKADLTVYVKGFQKSVDGAVSANADSKKVFDAAPAAQLNLKLSDTENIGEKDDDEEGDAGSLDPHFWLDPVRYKAVVQAISARMIKDDPANKATYEANTKKLVSELDTLDQQYRTTLSTCTNKTIVTGHAAFGYLAERYGLNQVGVSGVSPEEEPTPQRLKDVAAFVKKNKVTTVYAETLVSPKASQTIAQQTGAKVEVLDPLEGITSASNGKNYLEVMRSNLATLTKGQGCK